VGVFTGIGLEGKGSAGWLFERGHGGSEHGLSGRRDGARSLVEMGIFWDDDGKGARWVFGPVL
jgi:hypothetical protein